MKGYCKHLQDTPVKVAERLAQVCAEAVSTVSLDRYLLTYSHTLIMSNLFDLFS